VSAPSPRLCPSRRDHRRTQDRTAALAAPALPVRAASFAMPGALRQPADLALTTPLAPVRYCCLLLSPKALLSRCSPRVPPTPLSDFRPRRKRPGPWLNPGALSPPFLPGRGRGAAGAAFPLRRGPLLFSTRETLKSQPHPMTQHNAPRWPAGLRAGCSRPRGPGRRRRARPPPGARRRRRVQKPPRPLSDNPTPRPAARARSIRRHARGGAGAPCGARHRPRPMPQQHVVPSARGAPVCSRPRACYATPPPPHPTRVAPMPIALTHPPRPRARAGRPQGHPRWMSPQTPTRAARAPTPARPRGRMAPPGRRPPRRPKNPTRPERGPALANILVPPPCAPPRPPPAPSFGLRSTRKSGQACSSLRLATATRPFCRLFGEAGPR
jgi:hypothetical protein